MGRCDIAPLSKFVCCRITTKGEGQASHSERGPCCLRNTNNYRVDSDYKSIATINMDSSEYNLESSGTMYSEEGGKRNNITKGFCEPNTQETHIPCKLTSIVALSITCDNYTPTVMNDSIDDETSLLGSGPAIDVLIDDIDESLLNTPSKSISLPLVC